MKKILPYIILFSALAVSGSAAFYSVYGLSKLFAGASLQVIIMASSLEVSKLVIATLLHQYWHTLNRLLKIYLTIAVVTLVVITSAGIYGFLSSAYQITANQDQISTRGIELVESKRVIFEESKQEYVSEKDKVVASINELRSSLSKNNQLQRVDKKTGQLVNFSSTGDRKALEKQLDNAIRVRDELSVKIQSATDSISKYEIQKIELMNSSDATAELGPLKYMSGLTGLPMDRIVNYFLLMIIFVFDPLAISLVLAANFAFDQIRAQRKPQPELLQEEEEQELVPDVEPVTKPTIVDQLVDQYTRRKHETHKQEDVSKLEPLPNLTPNQIKTMSHNEIEHYIEEQKKRKKLLGIQ